MESFCLSASVINHMQPRMHKLIHAYKPLVSCVISKDEGSVDGGMVVVKPKPRKGLAAKAIDLLEWSMVKLMHDTKKTKPLGYLSGNFAPVGETPPVHDLPVKGKIPECLNGVFLIVGPNPKFVPIAGYHWFDGDGMIHGVRIKDGKASYVSRYVKTSRLKQEDLLGGSKFIKIGDLNGLFGLVMVTMQVLRTMLKVIDVSYGYGTANTALVYHNRRLLALNESDKPYAIRILEDGDMETIGLLDYDIPSFTAHPKVDQYTGEMFTFGYSQMPPYVTYRVVTKDGSMNDPVPITIPEPIMMHDFAITENYVIFMDLPLYLNLKEMVKERRSIFSFDPTKKARFGVMPRYAKHESSIKWFELPNCIIFHTANAWEEGDEVILISCRHRNLDVEIVNGNFKDLHFEDLSVQLYEMRFNMKNGVASQKRLSASAVELPRINERYIGRKQRYVYGTTLYPNGGMGIVKFDLHLEPETVKEDAQVGGNVSAIFDLGPGRFGMEAVFVARELSSNEDDGYLIFFVHDENIRKSELNVIDAKTMSQEPVAVVELPRRIPYGFHGLFVAEEQLKQQAKI